MLKKDHRRHIADQFNFHPKENIVVLIQIYSKEKSQHFISDYKMMSYRYIKLLSISFMETRIICCGAVLKILIWNCVRKLLKV